MLELRHTQNREDLVFVSRAGLPSISTFHATLPTTRLPSYRCRSRAPGSKRRSQPSAEVPRPDFSQVLQTRQDLEASGDCPRSQGCLYSLHPTQRAFWGTDWETLRNSAEIGVGV